ncbi:FIMAH domain-containing protein [Paenibacillus caui]|uniref:FIMAH domain-containing protein n=1 Tax=Paenibacillus caui TaxID=2873927 RepID=UPI001CA91B87|nr:metallophosphoesterase [Paenibacillus caui]
MDIDKRLKSLAIILIVCLFASLGVPPGGGGMAHAESGGAAIPPFLITELVPDTTNVNDADGYEFIEVYNNTDRAVNVKDYKILYRYLESATIWSFAPEDVVVPPSGTLVMWIINAYNTEKTAADFNAHYGTELVEGRDLVRIHSGGMANTRMREVVFQTNAGHELVSAFYNEGTEITEPDKGIFYRYPEDGSYRMALIGGGTDPATPGVVEAGQVPEQPIHIEDGSAPVIVNLTNAEVDPAQGVDLVAEVRDDSLVKTVTFFYKTEDGTEYQTANLTFDKTDFKYRYHVGFLELLGQSRLDYYFVATDGIHTTTSERFALQLASDSSDPRLNVLDGGTVRGETTIQASSDRHDADELRLLIDGDKVTDTYRGLESSAYFVFEAQGMNAKNAITTDKEILYMADQAVNNFDSVIAPIDAAKLREGENVIALRAGSSERPYFEDDPETNLDDYDVRDVRLILSDGTVIRPAEYADPEQLIDVGDNGRFLPVVYFTFDIPQSKLRSLVYRWDTADAADGEHMIGVLAPDGSEAKARILVDNTGPVLQTEVEEGKLYRGAFVIDASASDTVSGVAGMRARLDGKDIELPYRISSTELSAGEHVLTLEATDRAGNRSERTVTFRIPEETPDAPEVVSPPDGMDNVSANAKLQVRVSDPMGDSLDVTFYEGDKYDATDRERVSFYTNAAAWEPPPVSVPGGETTVGGEELDRLSASDDNYVTVDSTTSFPYVRMEVVFDRDIRESDTVQLRWEGKSLAGRKVTLYAWNHRTERWTAIDDFVPSSEEDFVLRGHVNAADYVRDRKVNVIVQDQIPARGDYDYTLVWMSDTQFYSELYPHIYESQVNWIKERAEEMNIRYVIHTGDIVNEPTAIYQWEAGDRYMKVLEDAGIPYGVLAGNHDVGTTDSDYTTYSKYFGEPRFIGEPHYAESYKDNRGHYDLISANGNDFIFLYMGWGVDADDMAWMNEALAKHPDRIAIIALHDYLLPSGVRSGIGNEVYREVVLKNPNVLAVLSGHYTGSALLTDEVDDDGDGAPDRKVYQMLNDYQDFEEGGMGYMKLLHIDSDSGAIYVNTYSPYKDDYNYYDPAEYPDKDELTLAMELTPRLKRVATDYMEARLYTGTEIGSARNVESGGTAEVAWSGLEGRQRYSWYAEVRDPYGGHVLSDVWSFTTGAVLSPPANVRAAGVTDTSIDLAWSKAPAEDGVRIQYDVYKDGQWHATVTDSVYASDSQFYYTVEGLKPDTEYRFHIVAKDERGAASEPSAEIAVRTEVNLAVVRALLEQFIASGELAGPLAVQLTNRLEQAEHHAANGAIAQAAKHMEDFLAHLNNPAMEPHVTPEAKQRLADKIALLLE